MITLTHQIKQKVVLNKHYFPYFYPTSKIGYKWVNKSRGK